MTRVHAWDSCANSGRMKGLGVFKITLVISYPRRSVRW
jgi:hypothetical protein